MRHRMVVALIALGTVLTSIPLYRAVKQEFIPTNVDEAEFEVSINGPEGTNLAVMNETVTAMEKDILETPGVRLVMSSAGGGFLGGSTRAICTCASHRTKSAPFVLETLERDEENPFNAFKETTRSRT